MTIEQYAKSNSVLDLFSNGKRIYNSLGNIARSSAGVLILIPLAIVAVIVIPPMLFISVSVLGYYLIRLSLCTKSVMKFSVNAESYSELYDLFLITQEGARKFKATNPLKQMNEAPFVLRPLFWFVYKYELLNLNMKRHLEQQLFEVYDPVKISTEDVNFMRTEISKFDHDWDDDELWADFQKKHHHLVV